MNQQFEGTYLMKEELILISSEHKLTKEIANVIKFLDSEWDVNAFN